MWQGYLALIDTTNTVECLNSTKYQLSNCKVTYKMALAIKILLPILSPNLKHKKGLANKR